MVDLCEKWKAALSDSAQLTACYANCYGDSKGGQGRWSSVEEAIIGWQFAALQRLKP